MCGQCGCHEHHHDHSHDHSHDHPHDHNPRVISVQQSVLNKNERIAERNRGYFLAKNWLVMNVLSSPGSGKTSFIAKTVTDLAQQLPAAVIVGDLATDNDAQRLRQTGVSVVQITTGDLCHLEADMVFQALQQLDTKSIRSLIIENVGNLVCPAAYDLGETLRVALLSTTEGEDKPLKYPTLFKSADVVIINKIDLAEIVEFQRDLAWKNIQGIAPQAKIFEVSAKTGIGMKDWYDFLESRALAKVDSTL